MKLRTRRISAALLPILAAVVALATLIGIGASPAVARTATAAPWQGDYEKVFPEFSAEAFNLDSEGRLTVYGSKVELTGSFKLPSDATPETPFDLRLSEDWSFVPFSGLSLETPDGTVVATAAATSTSLRITPTDNNQVLENVEGTFSFFVSPRLTGQERTVTLNVFSPTDQNLGPGSSYKFHKNLPNYTGGLLVPSVLKETELSMLTQVQYVNPPGQFDPETARFVITPVTEGAVPVCDPEVFSGRIWWIDSERRLGSVAGSPLISCDGNALTLRVPEGTTPPSGTSGLRIEGAYVVDRPLSEYEFSYTMHIGEEEITVVRAANSGIIAGTAAGQLRPAQTELTKQILGSYPDEVRVGDTITYRITTTSKEDFRTAYALVTTDKLPEGLQFVSASDSGKYVAGTRTVTWPKQDIGAGEERAYTVKAKVLDKAPPTLENSAKNVGENTCFAGDTTGSVCRASAKTRVVEPAVTFEKQVAKVADTNGNGITGDAGDTVTYRFSITNVGKGTETSAKLTDNLLGISGHECLKAPLPAGQSTTCDGSFSHVITRTEAAAGVVENSATLTVPGLKPLVSKAKTPAYAPMFALEKTVSSILDTNQNGYEGDPGDTIAYQIEVVNTGNSPLETVTVADELLGIENNECLKGTLEPGGRSICAGKFEYTITKDDAATGEVINTVLGASPGAPAAESSVTAPAAQPAFDFEKEIREIEDTNGNGIVGDPGDTIHFGFTATNGGNSILNSILIDDPLLQVNGLECLEGPLPPKDLNEGSEDTVVQCADSPKYSYVITQKDADAGTVINEAVATSPGAEPNEASVQVSVKQGPPEKEGSLANTGWRGQMGAVLVTALGAAALGASLLYKIRRVNR